MITEKRLKPASPTDRKRTTREVHSFDMAVLGPPGVFVPPLGRVWVSTSPVVDEPAISTVYFAVERRDPDVAVVSVYVPRVGSPSELDFDYAIRLVPSKCGPGGTRMWFQCPFYGRRIECPGERCRILYRPRSSDMFACRECHGLTYESRRLHGSFFGDVVSPLIDHLAALSNCPDKVPSDQERERLRKTLARQKSFQSRTDGES